jgi:hypothetical protein
MSELSLESRFKGCLLGLALGDAVGCTVEFRSRDKFEPLTYMVGVCGSNPLGRTNLNFKINKYTLTPFTKTFPKIPTHKKLTID